MFTATTVEPTGVPANIEASMPKEAQATDIITEQILTDLNVLNTRIADMAGKTINADISKAPTKFMARTITTAITEARIKLYIFALFPVAAAKFSSNVTANIL